jgi:hypothetical protein
MTMLINEHASATGGELVIATMFGPRPMIEAAWDLDWHVPKGHLIRSDRPATSG